MKSILEYQDIYFLNKAMITESFSCKLLQEITDQQNKKIQLDKEYNSKQTESWRKRDLFPTFKKLLGDKSILWNEIKDEDCIKYSKDNPEAIKIAKRMAANRSNHINGIIVLINSNEEKVTEETYSSKYTGVLFSNSWGCSYISLLSRWGWNQKGDPKPSDIEEFLSKEFIFVDLEKYSSNTKQSERRDQKSGSFNPLNNDIIREKEYEQIAERNRERYRKYLAKIKADKEANDNITEKVNTYVNKILSVTMKMSNDPIKYAKYEYDVCGLIGLIDEKKTYVHGTRQNKYKSYWTGRNGLMYLYKTYISKKLSLAKGDSYEHEKKEYDAAKKELEELFTYIDSKLAKFEE